MPHLDTRQLGRIEYQEEAVVEFPRGLPAFEDQTRFLLIEEPGFSPIVFLQSVLREDLCFLTIPVSSLDPDYRLSVALEDLETIGADLAEFPKGRLLWLAILSVSEVGPATANLLAPVVVNPDTRRGVQAVRLDAAYSHQHQVALPGRRASQEETACS